VYDVGLIVVLSSLILYGAAFFFVWVWRCYRRREIRMQFKDDFRPGVTILKPLAGVDEELEANLVSFFELDYEPLQIIFGSDRDDDSGMVIARRVAQRYPQRDCLILTKLQGTATSPKVVNLEAMLPHARHELVMLSDSNVRIRRDDMKVLVQPMRDARVGLVYQPVVGEGEISAGATVENLRLTEFCGNMTISAKMFAGQDCVMGKGMLCRREALREIDNFAQVRDTAADDYLLGVAIKRAGWRMRLGAVPARVIHIHWPVAAMMRRHTRHAAMRWRLNTIAYPMELLMMPLVVSLAAPLLSGVIGFYWMALGIVGKMAIEACSARVTRGHWFSLPHTLLIPVKDGLMLVVLFRALFESTVEWRGRRYRMIGGSKLVPLDTPPTVNHQPAVTSPTAHTPPDHQPV